MQKLVISMVAETVNYVCKGSIFIFPLPTGEVKYKSGSYRRNKAEQSNSPKNKEDIARPFHGVARSGSGIFSMTAPSINEIIPESFLSLIN